MLQPELWDWKPPLGSRFDGATYDKRLDFDRLAGNLRKVFDVLSDGEWHSAAGIRMRAGLPPEAAVLERVRDLRKPEVLGATVLTRRAPGAEKQSKGIWEYRLVLESLRK